MTTEKANISQGRKLSGIWIIPLLAIALGVYMVVHTWMTEGPTVTIEFSTAEGLAPGKTKVKYRNVDMGLVEEVRLSKDLERVIAKVKLDRQTLPLLREDTRFWVVTAQFGMGQVSGLGTLLSGAYIELSPGTGAKGKRSFSALEKAPLTPTDAAGLRLHLSSDIASSVSPGDTVMYKGFKVGRVEGKEFDAKERKVRYVIFVDAPYHELVDSSVRFWDVSGISLSAGADGFKVDTGSMESILLGGVAFGTPPGIKAGEPVDAKTEFQLYPDYAGILKNPYQHGSHYVVSFAQSIKGLLPGAPVEFRGIPIGRVERVMIKETIQDTIDRDMEAQGAPVPVLIYLEPGRLELPDQEKSIELMQKAIKSGVNVGMRATLQSGSLLTGAKYIGIDYYEGAESAGLGSFMDYPVIPTISGGLDHIEQKLTAVLDKINGLALEDTVTGANAAIASLQKTLDTLNALVASQSTQQVPAQLNATLRDLQKTINGLSPSSEVYRNLNSSLLRLNRTLSNMESVTRSLADQPNAVIMPSSQIPDPIPEIKR